MKKIYLFLLMSCILSSFCYSGYAQTAAGYTFTRSTGTYTSIVGAPGTVVLSGSGMNSDDGVTTSIPIGFTFGFCGTSYTTLSADANGWISLANSSASAYPNYVNATSSISTMSGGVGFLMVFWRDLYGSGANSYYQTSGSAGSRVFTMEWNNYSLCCGLGYGMNFQVKLFEGSNIIQYCYGSFTTDPGSSATIGICNSTTDYQTLISTTSTTCNTGFNTGCDMPASGSILQWAFGCSGTPTPGAVSASTSTSCSAYTSTLTLSGQTALPGVTTQWQSSTTSPTTGFSDISGATNLTYSATLASPGTVYYRNNVTCTISALSAATSGTTLVYNAPPTALSNFSMCTGSTTILSSSPATGTWSSSDITVASVSATGTVTAATAGTVNITYTLPSGCNTVATVTVNLAPPINTVLGGGGYCSGVPGAGVHIGLNGSFSGINYTLYSGSSPISTLAGTGSPLDFGLFTATGSYTVTAVRTAGGCSLPMIGAANVFLNANPSAITGPSNVCVAASIVLASTPAGGTWSSSNISFGTVNPTGGVVSGVAAGPITVTYTLTGGCHVTAPVVVNPIPASITGTATVCAGSTTILNTITSGGTWSSSNTSLATVGIGTGIVSGVSAGTANISYTLSSGCFTMTPVGINLLPVSFPVTGGGPYCAGTGVHIGLSFANSGISYQLYNGASPVGAAMNGSNSGLDFGSVTAPGTYTVFGTNSITGCGQTMSGSTTVSINPLPNTTYTISAGGNYCTGGTGVDISLSGSDFGTSYQLINGGPTGSAVPGTGSGTLDLGMQTATGTYTVLATTAAGCTGTMTGSANVGVNSLPNSYTLTGGGSYCQGGPGVDIILEGSDIGTNYQLFIGSTSVGAMIGTGSAIDFGFMAGSGSYTVVANNPATTCSANMAGSPIVTISPLPIAYSVTGGGNFCAGGVGVHIGLSYSSPGFSYQLFHGATATGITLAGSSSGLDFGFITTPGVYTVVATNTVTGCSGNMSGSATVTIGASLTPYPVTGGGPYCNGGSGDHIGLAGSSAGVFYQLYNGTTAIGSAVTGSGSSIDFGLHTAGGTYTVIATNPVTGCTNLMPGAATVSPVALPTAYNTVPAGSNSSYCAGGEGIDLLLDGSDLGTNYQLYKGMIPVGAARPGTGTVIDFGFYTTPGAYTIVANATGTGCSSNMAGAVNITITTLPNVYTVIGGGNYCVGGLGVHVGLSGSNPGVSYQLLNGGIPVGGAVLGGTGAALDFGYQATSGSYTVAATNGTTFCTVNMAGSAVVTLNSAPGPFSITGDGGSYCASAIGSPVGLSGSVTGIRYQLFNGGSAVGSAVAGTGSGLNFGLQGAGNYSVVATNIITGCSSNMPGTAAITANALPSVYPVTGTGNICSGGTGANVGLGNSDMGTDYQLYLGGIPTGGTVAGTGGAVTLGVETLAGAYTAVGVDGTTGCVNNMSGSAVVSVVPSPSVTNVIGGGSYCAGGAGEHIGLSGTDNSITYQLYNGPAAVGSPVTGTGFALDFGVQTAAGSYTVIASPGGACQTTMSGAATITVNPLPAVYSITGGGNYCAGSGGSDIGLGGSAEGVSYQLYNGSAAVGSSVTGGGSPLDFGLQTAPGTYTVTATNTTGCTANMTGSGSVMVNVSPLPVPYPVIGGGNYCTGGTGVHVELSRSNTNINYQLYLNNIPTGSLVAGTGTLLDFGLFSAVGHYTVTGTDAYTGCENSMADTATVAVESYLVPVVTISANPGLTLNPGQIVGFTANVTNGGTSPLYQWYIDGLPVTGATDRTFVMNNFSNNDSVRCVVTSEGLCGGISTAKSVTITVVNVGVQQVSGAGSDILLVPNPNKGAFTIKGNLGTTSDEEVSVEITDMVGHVVYTQKVMTQGGVINESIRIAGGVANGMYLVNLRSATENKVFHMVIEQ